MLFRSGWGISLMEQPGGVFAVWFTYDANGDPTWFVMPTGTWEDGMTYSGTLYKTHSSPWFGATICSPIGKPAPLKPTGTLSDGQLDIVTGIITSIQR